MQIASRFVKKLCWWEIIQERKLKNLLITKCNSCYVLSYQKYLLIATSHPLSLQADLINSKPHLNFSAWVFRFQKIYLVLKTLIKPHVSPESRRCFNIDPVLGRSMAHFLYHILLYLFIKITSDTHACCKPFR